MKPTSSDLVPTSSDEVAESTTSTSSLVPVVDGTRTRWGRGPQTNTPNTTTVGRGQTSTESETR